MFIERHANRLSRAGNVVEFVDWPSAGFAEKLRGIFRVLTARSDQSVEIHGYQSAPLLLMLFARRETMTSFWLHSGQFSARLDWWQRRILQAALNRIPDVILVSPHIVDILASNGFAPPTNPTIQHAFIPPDRSREQELWTQYDPALRRFAGASTPLLVMQGSDAFHDGVDRYGTDLAIEALARVRAVYPSVGLVVGRPSQGSSQFEAYRAALGDRIQQLGLGHSVYFLEGEQELFPITARADLFLRPSNQDGDSISIREAEFLGVRVVASDACPRLASCILFRSRSSESLSDAILSALAMGKPQSIHDTEVSIADEV